MHNHRLDYFRYLHICIFNDYNNRCFSKSVRIKIKIKYEDGLADIKMTGKSLIKLIFLSLCAGWLSGALGMGGGIIFNPLLMSLGHPPVVAAASGMYMMIFSAGASATVYVINDMINIPYGIWISAIVVFGTIAGMIALNWLMNKINR